MNELFTAIYNLFKADLLNDFYVGVSGQLYLNVAPQDPNGATFPYCVYFMVTDDYDGDFTDDHEEIEIQFNIFSESNSSNEAGDLLGYLKERFDFASLTIDGWNLINFQRRRVLPNNDFKQTPPIQGYSVMYDVLLERQRDNC